MPATVSRPLPLVAAVALAACGCGGTPDDKPARFPTRGTLTYNGRPLPGAVVTFHPLPLDKNDWRTVKPGARVEADGSFRANSYDLRDGAMAGEYAVTVLYTGEAGGPGPDLLQGRHRDPKRPVAKVTIAAGENVVPPIALSGPPLNPKAGKSGPH
ncbi:MAG: hypothetical protein K2X82_19890 [Gemmataceae bacterium]|nr:hypothetical protein [Gemmataceae bacterium]